MLTVVIIVRILVNFHDRPTSKLLGFVEAMFETAAKISGGFAAASTAPLWGILLDEVTLMLYDREWQQKQSAVCLIELLLKWPTSLISGKLYELCRVCHFPKAS